ncbi:ABC transporter permease [Streptomyces chiangmaiensis]|uniref:ABC transporter permease n=1 Tax=Streptomyces chiangmaiensis TaxID=766497 RepID=A0ABU7FN76_9ACTN|nr:ABC transporter permease [Streptomyces chiangmaiensis]MED7825263.1 ABC transporter permease [Streptomyces chiangmaiensis]
MSKTLPDTAQVPNVISKVRSRSWCPSARTRRGIISVAALVLGWHAMASLIVKDPLLLAGPLEVADVFLADLSSGELLTNLRVSLTEVALGMVIGISSGIALGLLVGASARVRDYADPFIAASYSAPLIALAPLMVLWLGIGMASKVAVVAIVVFFPVLISVASGVRTTSRTLLEVSRSFGAARMATFWKVLIPANVPATLAGIRIAVGHAIAAVVVAELFGARSGVGFAITQASFNFDTARIFLGVGILMLLGITFMELVRQIEHRTASWAFDNGADND